MSDEKIFLYFNLSSLHFEHHPVQIVLHGSTRVVNVNFFLKQSSNFYLPSLFTPPLCDRNLVMLLSEDHQNHPHHDQQHPNHGNHRHPSFSEVETLPCLKENLRCFIGATSLDSSEQSLLVVIVGGGAGVGAVQHLSSLLFTIDLTDNSSVQISGGRTTSGKGSSKKKQCNFLSTVSFIFYLVTPNFSTKKKTANQSITAFHITKIYWNSSCDWLISRVRHFGHKLFEMVGSAWILDLLNISDHFAF